MSKILRVGELIQQNMESRGTIPEKFGVQGGLFQQKVEELFQQIYGEQGN